MPFLLSLTVVPNYSRQFLAFLKYCETQDKFPNFLQDLQDSKNLQIFLLFLSFQSGKVVLKKYIFLNKSHEKLNKKIVC